MSERNPTSTLPADDLGTRLAASAGMGGGRLLVVVDGDLLMWSATHRDYAAMGEWAWVGREEPPERQH